MFQALVKMGCVSALGVLLFMGKANAEPSHYSVEVKSLPATAEGIYFETLLKMILTASKADNEIIDYHFSSQLMSQARWIAEVQQSSGNHIMWTVSTKERERVLRPIRVPIFKGLYGWRFLVIRKEDKDKFLSINSKQDLATQIAGQGSYWPDTDVLIANNMPVTVGVATENLYKMLIAKRFDYFPRGVTETDFEANWIEPNGLMVEPHLLLHYPEAIYFFVNRNNTELARRLEKGWEVILKNGKFDKLFFDLPRVKAALTELKKHQRTIIELENPTLPDDTPIYDSRMWFDVLKMPKN